MGAGIHLQVNKAKPNPLIQGSTILQFHKLGRAHRTYSSSTTVGTLKQWLVAEWPQGTQEDKRDGGSGL
ncbi:hypothetical protein SESBI_14182 [Sesbania bispinosa]|nr:hypothetical protein SESBI_14182 [Sesbania bispinosa]